VAVGPVPPEGLLVPVAREMAALAQLTTQQVQRVVLTPVQAAVGAVSQVNRAALVVTVAQES